MTSALSLSPYMYEWDVPLIDAETGKATTYRFVSRWAPEKDFTVGNVQSGAAAQLSVESRRKHIPAPNSMPTLLNPKTTTGADELPGRILENE